MYGAPVGTCQTTCVFEMSPRPPGRMAAYGPLRRGHHDRRAVRSGAAWAVDLPELLSGRRIERQQIGRCSVIAGEDQRVLKDHRRAAIPPVDVPGSEVVAEMARPDCASGQIDGDDLPRAEHGVDAPAVGDRARAGEIVLVVDR